MLDFKQVNFLPKKVREPTRDSNVVDLIFSKEDDLFSEVAVGECLAGIDHHMVWYTVGANVSPKS